MKTYFIVCDSIDNSICIQDITQEKTEDGYLEEDAQKYGKREFKYSDTNTVNYLKYVRDSQKSNTYEGETYVTDHSSYFDEVHIDLSRDGYYEITHFILPTVDWIEKIKNNQVVLESYYDSKLKSTDFVNSLIAVSKLNDKDIFVSYKIKKQDEVYSLEEPKQVNIKNIVNLEDYSNTTIILDTKTLFVITRLKKCYIDICQELFNKLNLRCYNKNEDNKRLIYNRDFIRMTLDVISYCVEETKWEKAQDILEAVNTCNCFCKNCITCKDGSCGCN